MYILAAEVWRLSLDDCDHVTFCDGFNPGSGQGGEIYRFCGDDVPRNIVVIFFQVLREMADRTALAGAMSNENDLIGR